MTDLSADERRAQQEAARLGIGVNDHHGRIWLPPLDGCTPRWQPDYGQTYRPDA